MSSSSMVREEGPMVGTSEGLRERKKRLTREGLAANAQRMFRERGFDQVTVAEIAAASDVSVKTLFVYYASKEDLVFADEFSLLHQLEHRLTIRPPGTSPLAAVRALARELLSDPQDDDGGFAGFVRLVGDNPELHGRLLLMWERYEQRLAVHLAAGTGSEVADAGTRMTAALLIAPFRVLTSPDVRAHLQPEAVPGWLEDSFDRVGRGISPSTPTDEP